MVSSRNILESTERKLKGLPQQRTVVAAVLYIILLYMFAYIQSLLVEVGIHLGSLLLFACIIVDNLQRCSPF